MSEVVRTLTIVVKRPRNWMTLRALHYYVEPPGKWNIDRVEYRVCTDFRVRAVLRLEPLPRWETVEGIWVDNTFHPVRNEREYIGLILRALHFFANLEKDGRIVKPVVYRMGINYDRRYVWYEIGFHARSPGEARLRFGTKTYHLDYSPKLK